MIPRSANKSSTSRKLKVNLTYSQIASHEELQVKRIALV